MPAEYYEIASPHLNRVVHRWRRVRQCCTLGIYLFPLFAFISLPTDTRVATAFVLIAVLLFPLRLLAHYRVLNAWVQKNQTLCPRCGYDLRPHDVPSCVECGYELSTELRRTYSMLREARNHQSS